MGKKKGNTTNGLLSFSGMRIEKRLKKNTQY